ncbi:MAG: M23 family metallopeptidase [Clostridia bacterium]|nr:M23 family metallopeptidase [Clostridia bacterium]
MKTPNKFIDPNSSADIEQKTKKNKNFYIAIAICVTAISAAAWSTYESLKSVIVPNHSENELKSPPNALHNFKSKSEVSTNENNSLANEKNAIPFSKQKSKNNSVSKNDTENEDLQQVSVSTQEQKTVYPIGEKIVKEFSDGKPVYSETMKDWRSHNGIDFQAEKDCRVKSVADGLIKDIYDDPSYGITIVIEHIGQFTAIYSGLSDKIFVKKGDKVGVSQEIGSIDKVPCEMLETPHLHFSVLKDGKYIDPSTIFSE